jgi:hypothetical protein
MPAEAYKPFTPSVVIPLDTPLAQDVIKAALPEFERNGLDRGEQYTPYIWRDSFVIFVVFYVAIDCQSTSGNRAKHDPRLYVRLDRETLDTLESFVDRKAPCPKS